MTVRSAMPRGPSITELPNLGPKSHQALAAVGISTVAQLRKVGSVAAYSLAKRNNSWVSLNLLWALEAALSGTSWQVVAREHRTSLLLALEEHERVTPNPSLHTDAYRRLRRPPRAGELKR